MKGGEFMIRAENARSVFIPEEFSEEQIMMADSVIAFMMREIHPIIDTLDSKKDSSLNPILLEKAGEMGLNGVSIPEQFGGSGLDFTSNILFGEVASSGFCFATTLGVQTSLGSLPIVYYGSPEQKEKYLPGIASGKIKVAYCLTEPSAGSDANSGKSKAIPTPDGQFYMLNGQKMWITNGGFADLFIVFAKIENDRTLSAFIVEKNFGGIETGAEEKKLGIKGSSTVQVFFNDCPVPARNLLGKRGEGFRIALNILNSGRFKVAAGGVGGSKVAIDKAVKYATERKQFGKAIGEFGAIKYKLAEMASRTFASESALYRTGKEVDNFYLQLRDEIKDPSKAMLKALREYVIECSMLKVHGSEVVDYCVDECLQIFGGMGYAEETGIERAYRDTRITRIYEGTSEINRMLSVGELMRKGFKTRELDLMKPVKGLPSYLIGGLWPIRKNARYAKEKRIVRDLKMAFLLVAATAGKKYKKALIDEQEIIMNLADMLSEAYIAESVWLRIEKLNLTNSDLTEDLIIKEEMARIFTYSAIHKVRQAGEEAIRSFEPGFRGKMLIFFLRRLTRPYSINPKNSRRKIADFMLAKNCYPFSPYEIPSSSLNSMAKANS